MKLASLLRDARELRHATLQLVALGGLVVSVLAIGPKVREFKPGRGQWIFFWR
jgi:hypothetical protein